jgi:F0F1-type ATP synthase delta subunit
VPKIKKTTPTDKVRNRKKLRSFLEEFSWLLDSYVDTNFKEIPHLINPEKKRTFLKEEIFEDFSPENPNIHFMVGVLPAIFSNAKIFPTNEDIADFSERILRLKIPRWTKKSKNEIIGHIVCNANKLNDKQLSKLTKALAKIVSGDRGANKIIKQAKTDNLDWNVIIQQLTLDDF